MNRIAQKEGWSISNKIALGALLIGVLSFCGQYVFDNTTDNSVNSLKAYLESVNNVPQSIEAEMQILGKFPNASSTYLNSSDLENLNAWELNLMRNEIYGRNGYIFSKNKDIIEYFKSQNWYKLIKNKTADPDLVYRERMNDFERANIEIIKKYEKRFEK